MHVEAKLESLGLALPAAPSVPPEITISFAWVRRRGNRVYVAGHSAQRPDGTPAGPFGTVPTEVSLEAARERHGTRRSPSWPASSASSATSIA